MLTVEEIEGYLAQVESSTAAIDDAQAAADAADADASASNDAKLAAHGALSEANRTLSVIGSKFFERFRVGNDVTGPIVTNESPADEATEVAVDTAVSVEFDEPLGESVDASMFDIRNLDAPLTPTTVTGISVDESRTTVTIEHDDLAAGIRYAVFVSKAVVDPSGNPLREDYQQVNGFTTAA
jgi:hypothetical protein